MTDAPTESNFTHVTSNLGKSGPWTKEQLAVIDLSIPGWHHFSLVRHPKLDGRNAILTKWKKKETSEILKNSVFRELDVDKLVSMRESIMRKFTNYRTRNRNTGDQGPEPKCKWDKQELLERAANAIIDMKSFTKGKSLFKRRKHAEILEKRDLILSKTPGCSQIGAYQKSLSMLWSDADQEWWENRASSEKDEQYDLDEHFPIHLFGCLRALCQAGGLDNLNLTVFYCYRDRKGKLRNGRLEAHPTDETMDFAAFEPEAFSHLMDRHKSYAAMMCPMSEDQKKSLLVGNVSIPRNKSGLPTFPTIDPESYSYDILRKIVAGYFGYVWEFCRPDDGMIQWDKIEERNDIYFDTDLHTFSFTLAHPSKLSRVCLDQLIRSLSASSSTLPFTFFTSDFTAEEASQHPETDALPRPLSAPADDPLRPLIPMSTNNASAMPDSNDVSGDFGLGSLDLRDKGLEYTEGREERSETVAMLHTDPRKASESLEVSTTKTASVPDPSCLETPSSHTDHSRTGEATPTPIPTPIPTPPPSNNPESSLTSPHDSSCSTIQTTQRNLSSILIPSCPNALNPVNSNSSVTFNHDKSEDPGEKQGVESQSTPSPVQVESGTSSAKGSSSSEKDMGQGVDVDMEDKQDERSETHSASKAGRVPVANTGARKKPRQTSASKPDKSNDGTQYPGTQNLRSTRKGVSAKKAKLPSSEADSENALATKGRGVKRRRGKLDDVILSDGRRGKLRRVHGWAGGWFFENGSVGEAEEDWVNEYTVVSSEEKQ